MTIELAIINQWIAEHALVFARIAGMTSSMVILGTRNVPIRIRLFTAIALTIITVPVVSVPDVAVDEVFSLAMSIQVMMQTVIGLAIGFVTRLVFETFVVAGQVIAMQTGLGFASLVDPSSGVSVPALGQLLVMMATLIFLSLDGHLQMIQVIVLSFESLPISESVVFFAGIDKMIYWAQSIFTTAFMMVLSAVVALLVVNLSFGVMTRAAPQINLFVIGFPVTMIAGLMIVWLILRSFIPHFIAQIESGQSLICQLLLVEC
ncbi:flagellar biosynthetic protein FliR [Pleionea sp. CnH1-48]|uniref:flagellar biosynthetic protein FliR n=1 Tax=Pleionea sp. CnH1-48 TaxID=2954494 RepID=UPI002096EE9C|nr:flagellar biosynthetic protein FliR [Pleionea sp. CnH1-48]MCO7226103.1 flagellar biosynthetic protein FliR [Pleionea sp. CnH1-48]